MNKFDEWCIWLYVRARYMSEEEIQIVARVVVGALYAVWVGITVWMLVKRQ